MTTDLEDLVKVRVDQPEGSDVGAAVLEVFQLNQMKIETRDDVVVIGRH